ncbi:MAG: nucleoside diphosphate kinase regulator [Curvibacter lanceolatus]|jgi:regulator of nucleoside diphosphate kinase|uniref:nucleoside diphosphate kinase regulator n=1 Tax=Curvibacter lanceolatus TaxID=86182 RepID=UPI0004CE91D8|nr:nucleoside diphosphate kinase regulator [Curvibacter lanceolatus]MBV5293090.1 nucleoside diphosphate kinase regulator [Curvibacter lanceolatus]
MDSKPSASRPLSAAEHRVLTELDEVRLRRLRERQPLPEPLASALATVLDESDVVPSRDIPPGVVTMQSRVTVQPVDGGPLRHITLAYPAEAQPEKGQLSVLSPVGLALLGWPVGQPVQWQTPDGREACWIIVSIEYQPEAAGHFTV